MHNPYPNRIALSAPAVARDALAWAAAVVHLMDDIKGSRKRRETRVVRQAR